MVCSGSEGKKVSAFAIIIIIVALSFLLHIIIIIVVATLSNTFFSSLYHIICNEVRKYEATISLLMSVDDGCSHFL